MPVSVALGGDPILPYAATAPLPDGIDEFMFAGFLRRKPVEMVRCKTNDLEVPASADFVLEGYVDVDEPLRREGPFGDHTGYYSLADDYPTFHLTAITRRENPIYATTVVGPPPQEDAWLGKATERLFLPLLQMTFPEIIDMNLPIEGCFHNLCIVSIHKEYPHHARKICHSLWGMGQMMFAKCIIVVDDDVNVQDVAEVAWRALNNIDAKRDVFFAEGPIDVLDHASQAFGFGGKLGVDATRKWKEEGFTREWPEVLKMRPDVVARVDALWKELGLVAMASLAAEGADVRGMFDRVAGALRRRQPGDVGGRRRPLAPKGHRLAARRTAATSSRACWIWAPARSTARWRSRGACPGARVVAADFAREMLRVGRRKIRARRRDRHPRRRRPPPALSRRRVRRRVLGLLRAQLRRSAARDARAAPRGAARAGASRSSSSSAPSARASSSTRSTTPTCCRWSAGR